MNNNCEVCVCVSHIGLISTRKEMKENQIIFLSSET